MGRKKLPLRYMIGRRGVVLLFLAILDFAYAIGLAFPNAESANNATSHFLTSVLPLDTWAAMWLVVGVLCLIHAFRRKDALGFAAAMFIKVLWAIMFFLGFLFAGVERGYLGAAVWGGFAALLGVIATWPDDLKARGGVDAN